MPDNRDMYASRADLRVELHGIAEWEAYRDAHPEIFDPDVIASIISTGQSDGVVSEFFGPIVPERVQANSPNHREDFVANGYSPRLRAILDLFTEHPASREIHEACIYAHEALTPFALLLRGRYPRFIGSEYASDEAGTQRLFPIPVVDITCSPFPDGAFDVVISNEVLEHVTDLDAALVDTARILARGGTFLATFPFGYNSETTDIRAVIEGGQIRHFAEPEYHGNPTDPGGGALVFQVPGWDIIERALAAGFVDASMIFWSSHARGYCGEEIAGVFIFQGWR